MSGFERGVITLLTAILLVMIFEEILLRIIVKLTPHQVDK